MQIQTISNDEMITALEAVVANGATILCATTDWLGSDISILHPNGEVREYLVDAPVAWRARELMFGH